MIARARPQAYPSATASPDNGSSTTRDPAAVAAGSAWSEAYGNADGWPDFRNDPALAADPYGDPIGYGGQEADGPLDGESYDPVTASSVYGSAAPPLTYGLIDDLGVREVQRLLARHLAAAQAAFGPPGLGVIDLPHLPGGRLVPAQIHAAAVLYWAAEVERAGLLPFVEALAQGLIDGAIVIPLGGAAQRLGEYWHSRTHRFTAAERAALYARVLGEPFAPAVPGALPGGAGSPAGAGAGPGMPGTRATSGGDSIYSTPPGMITPDPLAPLTGGDPLEPALRSLVGQLVAIGRAGPLSGGTGLISARAVVQAQNLGAMLTQRGAGVAAFAARDIVAQIRSALQILGDGDLSRALGGGSPWQIVARHAPAFLRRVVDAPMSSNRVARPVRTDLAGRVVADGEHEVERRRAGRSELVPALAAEALGRQAVLPQQFEGERVDSPGRMAARAVRDEATPAEVVHHGLGQDRPRGIAGAQKQHMFWLPVHR